MRLPAAQVIQAKGETSTGLRLGVKGHLGWQQDRQLELDVNNAGSRQATFHGGYTASFGPHAVSNGTGKTEQLGREGVQVNRVAVA